VTRDVPARRADGRFVALATIAALAWSFFLLGAHPIATPSEARYAQTAREMIEDDSLLVPQLFGRPHLTKPPGAYWAIGAGIAAFGRDAWAVRAALGLAFAGTIVAAGVIGGAATGRRRDALWAGIALATAPLAYVGGSIATTDGFLAAAEAVALAAGAVALVAPERRRSAVRLMWAALGAAMLVKGPVGLLPLAGVLAAWRLRVAPDRRDRLADPLALGAFALLGLVWYGVVFAQDPSRVSIVRTEIWDRLTTNALRRNSPAWVPLALLVVGTLPWAPFLVFGRRRAVERGRHAAVARMLVVFVLAGLALFTLSQSRQPIYVVPLTIGVAALAGLHVAAWSDGRRVRAALVAGLVAVTAVGLVALRAAGASVENYPSREELVAAVERRLDAEDETVYLLQIVPDPGLAFGLEGRVLRVAMEEYDEGFSASYELTRAEFFDRLANAGADGLVAVAPPRTFQGLPSWIERERAVFDQRSLLWASRLRVRQPSSDESRVSSHRDSCARSAAASRPSVAGKPATLPAFAALAREWTVRVERRVGI
jgi:4-amino-4-deoxy-L-arabinose transferase